MRGNPRSTAQQIRDAVDTPGWSRRFSAFEFWISVSVNSLCQPATVMRKNAISEVRTILLPIETVVDAILEFDCTHRRTFCGGKLLEARIEDGENRGILLVVLQGVGDAAKTVESRFGLAAVAAAIIQYCAKSYVPLPRNSTKGIAIVPEGFQLTLRTRNEVKELHSSVSATWQASSGTLTRAESVRGDPMVNCAGDAALFDPTHDESDDLSPASAA